MPFTAYAAGRCPFERIPVQSRLNMRVVINVDGVVDAKKWMVMHWEVNGRDRNDQQKDQKERGLIPNCKPARLQPEPCFWLGNQTSRRHSSSWVINTIVATGNFVRDVC